MTIRRARSANVRETGRSRGTGRPAPIVHIRSIDPAAPDGAWSVASWRTLFHAAARAVGRRARFKALHDFEATGPPPAG